MHEPEPVNPVKPDINTNTRLFDLVRYARAHLFEKELITEDEYGWLLAGSEMAKGAGSPSPRRLEDYDEIHWRLNVLEKRIVKALAACGGAEYFDEIKLILEGNRDND